ncbi:MAG: hypothetical protein ABSB40_11855 [Nitrososphaeria archaeon]|jgi:hypothetical protein
MTRHKPPSRIKYEKNNPIISVRLTRGLKDKLDNIKEKKSYHQLIVEGLEKCTQVPTEEILKEKYNEGYKKGLSADVKQAYYKGFEDGIHDTENDFEHFKAPCGLCGEMITFSPEHEDWIWVKEKILKTFVGWPHSVVKCKRFEGEDIKLALEEQLSYYGRYEPEYSALVSKKLNKYRELFGMAP